MIRSWGLLLGGLLVWAADFFLLYAIASIFLDTRIAQVLALLVTLAALAANGLLFLLNWRQVRSPDSDYDGWIARIGLLGAAISALAVLWQGFPAILV